MLPKKSKHYEQPDIEALKAAQIMEAEHENMLWVKAFNKVYAKTITLQHELERAIKDVKQENIGGVDMDAIRLIERKTREELQTWEYILKIIEANEHKH